MSQLPPGWVHRQEKSISHSFGVWRSQIKAVASSVSGGSLLHLLPGIPRWGRGGGSPPPIHESPPRGPSSQHQGFRKRGGVRISTYGFWEVTERGPKRHLYLFKEYYQGVASKILQ